MLDSDMMEPPDRPGEDEWDPELEAPSRPKKSRKSSSLAKSESSSSLKPKGKRGRPAKNKGYKSYFLLHLK